MANKGGFSWKRAVGISGAKRKISRATGIPTTKQGRKRKAARVLSGGCLTYITMWLLALSLIILLILGAM